MKHNITDAITKVMRSTKDSAKEINRGNCDWFADQVSRLVSGVVIHTTPDEESLPGHYWIEYNGLHYDAECPTGIKDWRHLPIFQ